MTAERKKACVTGGNGFMASLLISQLLERGYDVNATVRDPGDINKVSHLIEMRGPGKLEFFRAELGEEGSFDAAVTGCHYVFHVATPVNVMANDPENELIKPAIEGVVNVMRSYMKAKTIKRIVMTSSAGSASVNSLKETGLVVKEDWWSDTEFLIKEKPPTWGYLVSKTLAEKEAWDFAQQNNLDLVTIIPGLMLGTALTLDAPPSVKMGLSLFLGDEFKILKIMEEVSGSISMVHVEDVCRAHIFVAEAESASGRYICCTINTNVLGLAKFLSQTYPQYNIPDNFSDLPVEAKLSLSSEKLIKAGFQFKHPHLEKIYDETIEYARAAGVLPDNFEQKKLEQT